MSEKFSAPVLTGLSRLVSWFIGCLDWIYSLTLKPTLFSQGIGEIKPFENFTYKNPSEIDEIKFEEDEKELDNGVRIVEGVFRSPLEHLLPEESKNGYVLRVFPPEGTQLKGTLVIMTHFGDKGYTFRLENYAKDLAKEGYICVLLMLSFYAKRKPAYQSGGNFVTVSDMFLFAMATIIEGAGLIRWLRRSYPDLPVGITGLSFGGGMAIAAASLAQETVAVAPMMGACGAHTIVDGILYRSVDTKVLTKELGTNMRQQLRAMYYRHSCVGAIEYGTAEVSPKSRMYVVGAAFAHDRFITKRLNEEFLGYIDKWAVKSTLVILPGGHVFGFSQNKTYKNLVRRSFELLAENAN